MSDLEPTIVAGRGRPPGRGRRSGWLGLPGWLWALVVLAVLVVGILGCGGLALLYAYNQRPALRPGATPTITLLTRPAPSATASAAPETPAAATPGSTGAPPETPTITPTLPPPPPGTIKVGDRVQVVNTGGDGLSLRDGPGQEYPRVAIGLDGEILQVVDGPRAIGGFTWWQLKRSDGVQGWGVQNFLKLVTP